MQASKATCPASEVPFSPKTLNTLHCCSVKPCLASNGLKESIIASLARNIAIGSDLLVSGLGTTLCSSLIFYISFYY